MVTDSCADCRGADLVVAARGLANLTGGVDVERNPSLQVGPAGFWRGRWGLVEGAAKGSLPVRCAPRRRWRGRLRAARR